MTTFEMMAALLTLAALLSYFNYKFLKLPTVIGMMALSLVGSMILILVGMFVPSLEAQAKVIVEQIDLKAAFLQGMLGFMLFAGALHIDLSKLKARRWSVATLSTVGVTISTLIVGVLTYVLLLAFGIEARWIYCFLFGALISPTDPIAVMAILRQAGVPDEMEVTIAGESLFNDGVGVVIFLGLLEIATGQAGIDAQHIGILFLREAVGGAVLGFVLGWIVYRMLRSVDNYQVEVLLSIGLAAGGFALATALHVSGPIAMVVAGLLIGNYGRAYAMSSNTVQNVDKIWELIDEVLNAILFVVIGLEVLALNLTGNYLVLGLIAIPLVLLARLIAVAGPITLLNSRWDFPRSTIRVLTWGGLRGGISIALALSIPKLTDAGPIIERDPILAMTYVVVVFSILVQGLTLGPLAKRWLCGGERTVPRSSGNE